MKNKQSKVVLMTEKSYKKIVVLFVCLVWMVQTIYAQNLTYFVLDTASPYNIIKMTAKNEIPWPLQSGSWHWKKERQLTENVEKHVL